MTSSWDLLRIPHLWQFYRYETYITKQNSTPHFEKWGLEIKLMVTFHRVIRWLLFWMLSLNIMPSFIISGLVMGDQIKSYLKKLVQHLHDFFLKLWLSWIYAIFLRIAFWFELSRTEKAQLLETVIDYRWLCWNKGAGVSVYLRHFWDLPILELNRKSLIFRWVLESLGLIISFYVNFLTF